MMDFDSDGWIQNDILYTEDAIPVRTVYVSGLQRNVQHDKLLYYFQTFGEVESLRIHQNQRNAKKVAFAFVTFVSDKVACKVIRKNRHKFFGRTIVANKADSWHQPRPNISVDNTANQSDTTAGSENMLHILNDDCLLHLCQYLSIIDITQLSQVSTRLKSFVEDNIYRKYVSVDLDTVYSARDHKYLSLMDLRNLFMNLSGTIKILKTSCYNIPEPHDRIMDLIHKYLGNLQELHLQDINVNTNSFRKRNFQFLGLKVLNMKKCSGVKDIFLRGTPNIIELRLSHMSDITGECLPILQKLEILAVKYCTKFNPKELGLCFQNNLNLRRLTVRGFSDNIPKWPEFRAAFLNLKRLEYVCSDSLKNWPIENLESLKYLNMSHSLPVPSLKQISEKDQLEELDLSWNIKFQDKESDFQKYLLNFTKLKVLNLNFTTFANEELLLKLAEKLDLKFFGLKGNEISENGCIKLVELNKHLETICFSNATSAVIKGIINIVNNDLSRPKLLLAVDIEEHEKNSVLDEMPTNRVEIASIPPIGDSNDFGDNFSDDMDDLHDEYDIFPEYDFDDDYDSDYELFDDFYDYRRNSDDEDDDDFPIYVDLNYFF